ncbi:NAD(+) synthase [Blattabacterium sp. (Cryptocercus kyebangensis)]|uniref:NAD(+) synthase n=1 Tax=Blattabacterium sp. (Cryptocercus kyebangensis) TaxID=298656 RepID=UPI000D7C1BE5|nr:NAD(+) synthase [Blattabacterium sp. (Cryptocercus kyebangensis)]AWU43936.1 NAD(+) synthase [Blattabacterium sp. (Cryptocercus kyebangensis)]
MINAKKVIEYVISWLRKYIKKSQSNGFIIGLSGGIDSSVTSMLVAMTQYPTLTLEMPILEKDKNLLSQKHAIFLKSKFLNVHHLKKDLSSLYLSFFHTVDDTSKKRNKTLLALANTKSRIRMITLYYYANINNYLVVGTGNKIEDFGVGFFTKYGDGGVDIHPIADLTKSEIRLLAKELKILDCIQKAKPTDGLWDDQRSDEDQLEATYEELEWAMKITEEEKKFFNYDIFKEREKNVMQKYKTLHQKNMHKIIPIPICKIPYILKKN